MDSSFLKDQLKNGNSQIQFLQAELAKANERCEAAHNQWGERYDLLQRQYHELQRQLAQEATRTTGNEKPPVSSSPSAPLAGVRRSAAGIYGGKVEAETESESDDEEDVSDDEDTFSINSDDMFLMDFGVLFSLQYGLKNCFKMNLGSCPTTGTVASRLMVGRILIEESLLPIGLAVAPSGHYADSIELQLAYDRSMDIHSFDLREAVGILVNDMMAQVSEHCSDVAASRTAKSLKEAPRAFCNMMELFSTVLRPYKWDEFGPMHPYRLAQLNDALNAMLKTFTDKELGLIGSNSRRFVRVALKKLLENQAAANAADDGSGDDLPSQRARRE